MAGFWLSEEQEKLLEEYVKREETDREALEKIAQVEKGYVMGSKGSLQTVTWEKGEEGKLQRNVKLYL
jgi:hypothetical protein